MPIARSYAVVKRQDKTGWIMMVLAHFRDAAKAQAWCDNANAWYGEDHPLTPLVVIRDVWDEPPLFPVMP